MRVLPGGASEGIHRLTDAHVEPNSFTHMHPFCVRLHACCVLRAACMHACVLRTSSRIRTDGLLAENEAS